MNGLFSFCNYNSLRPQIGKSSELFKYFYSILIKWPNSSNIKLNSKEQTSRSIQTHFKPGKTGVKIVTTQSECCGEQN